MISGVETTHPDKGTEADVALSAYCRAEARDEATLVMLTWDFAARRRTDRWYSMRPYRL